MDLYKTKPAPLTEPINNIVDILKEKHENNIVNNLDYRTSANRFPLKCWFPTGTWIIDEVLYNRFPMVFCLEGNSRYIIVKFPNFDGQAADKKVLNALKLERLIKHLVEDINREADDKTKHVRKVQHIIWDSATTHKSLALNRELKRMKITAQMINVNKEPHGALHVLDRAVRTIRDLIENYHKQFPNEQEELQEFLPKIIMNYNRSPHRTLEKMTFIRGMTPWNVHINDILEKQVVRYCQIWNYNVKMKGNYDLEIGDQVVVKVIAPNKLSFKKRGIYHDTIHTIVGKEDGRYRLDPAIPDLPLVPRSMLVKIKKKVQRN